jgi:hypothetical protein
MKLSENGAPILSGSGLKTVREHIAQEFERVRTIERRRKSCDGVKNLGRRKSDPPRPQLSQLAQPILQQIKTTGMPHRRNHGACWEIEEFIVEDVSQLLSECEEALGFKKPAPDVDSLRTCLKAERPSIWQKDIFRRAR